MYEDTDDMQYEVVVNDEEQYSIWSVDLPCPAGWQKVGVAGDKQTCLEYIDRTWTDMRPRSLREHMARAAGGGSA
jgi:MbtH protein